MKIKWGFLIWGTIFTSWGQTMSWAKDSTINLPGRQEVKGTYELFTLQIKSGLLTGSPIFMDKFKRQLESDFQTYQSFLVKEQRFLIKETLKRLTLLSGNLDVVEKTELINQILEMAQAFYYLKHTAEYESSLESLPKHPFFRGYIHPYWGNLQAYNVYAIQPNQAINVVSPLSLSHTAALDPLPSAFWSPRDKKFETYNSLDKQKKWCDAREIFYFDKKKTPAEFGGGRNPGVKVFKVDGEDKDYFSLKFTMNQNTGMGTIFHTQEGLYENGISALYEALGYNTDLGVYCPGVTLRFHPSFLNLTDSKIINPKIWQLGFYYKSFILDDGTEVSFNQAMSTYHYLDHSQINEVNIEGIPVNEYKLKDKYVGRISYIKTYPVYLEKRSKKQERVIRWDRDGLSHEDRREIRGLLIADSWLGAMDNYGFNLKLVFNKKKDESLSDWKFTLVDNGHSLAAQDVDMDTVENGGYLPLDLRAYHLAADWVGYQNLYNSKYKKYSDLEIQMARFSENIFNDGQTNKKLNSELDGNQMVETLSKDLHGLNNHRALRYLPHTKKEDLEWMVRKIASLQEWQIYHALAQTGLGHPGAVLITEKLLHRRDQLVQYFSLENEFPLLRKGAKIEALNVSGSNEITVFGERVVVPDNGWVVVEGKLKIKP